MVLRDVHGHGRNARCGDDRAVFRRVIFTTVSALFLITANFIQTNLALAPQNQKKTGEFLITKWTTEQGLPQNSVTSIVQTADGYLWVGTFGGLARFDGIKFTIFDSANTPVLDGNRIFSLYEDSRNRLWIGTETGEVYIYSNGVFREFNAAPPVRRGTVLGFQEDADGNFYVSSTVRLEKFRLADTEKVNAAGKALLDGDHLIYKDERQRIWVNFESRFYVIENDVLIAAKEKGITIPAGIVKIRFTGDNKIFAGGGRSFGVIDGKNYRTLLTLDDSVAGNYFDIEYKDGSGWFQQGDYIFEWNGNDAIRHDLSDFVENGSRVIYFDKEENLWLGTSKDGLVRLTRRNVDLVSDMTDFELKNTYAVVQDSKETVWVAGLDLLKIENGRVRRFAKVRDDGAKITIRSLAVDARDNLWVGEDYGLNLFRNDSLVPVPEFSGKKIDALFFDNKGNLWAGGTGGIYRFRDGNLQLFTTADGLVHNKVSFITQLGDGRIWIGTMGGMSIFDDGKFVNYTTAEGLAGNYVREIFEDADGSVWIGTYGGGVNRWRDGNFRVITKDHGLHDNFVSRILADDNGRFWILGNQGVFAVRRDDLNDIADGRKKTLVSAVYGTFEDLKYSEGSGGHQPAGNRTKDGRMWFPLIEDMVIIDPAKPAGISPKTVIERASSKAGGNESRQLTQLTKESVIEIEDGLRNLEIEYTGLSFTKPEKIRFFYKLEGLDDDWIDAGTRRTAFYPYLPSGEYVFQVKAVNINGVWSENAASIKIRVAKKFWQTGWFLSLAAIVVVVGLFSLDWLRLKKIEDKQKQQQEFAKRLINAHESERRRIATELHDGLGQNLLIIKNWALHGLDALAKKGEIKEHLKKISETAADSLDETRAIVANLSPQNLKRFGLTEAVNNMVEQIEDSSGVVFAKKIENIDGIFSDETEISIFRIVQECLNNIVKHSESPRGEIRISRYISEIEIMIRDYGKGFAADKYFNSETRARGFGLQSIVQRTNLLGGELTVDSNAGQGTVIRIRIKV